ncbi:MAG: SelB C-terminal domain-containing protein, partial [Bryobacteraceae bacterium]
LPGDRFIVRMFSPVVTIGGGVVLDTSGRRYRRDENPEVRLRTLDVGTPADKVALFVRESRFGTGLPELIARTGLLAAEIEAAAAKAPGVVRLSQPETWFVDRNWFQETCAGILAKVSDFHSKNPLLPGLPRHEIRGRELMDAPQFLLDELVAALPSLVSEGEFVRLETHRLALKEDEERALTAMEALFTAAGLAVPPVSEVLGKAGVEMGRARSLLQILLKQNRLVRVSESMVFHAEALRSLREMVSTRRGERFSVPAFKQWTGISRKYAIPLLEYLDREHVTLREGDERVIL